MRQEYQYYTSTIITAGHDYKVYGERVKPGWILKVLTCFLHMPDSGIQDVAEIFVDQGSRYLEIRSRARDAAKQGLEEKICLTVIGEMIPLKKWRKGKV